MADPLMPAARRYPVNAREVPFSTEHASNARPFALLEARPNPVCDDVVEAKHRTPKSRVPHTQDTSLDSKTVKDTYYTPDD